MSGIRSRSKRLSNAVPFRHARFFEEEPEWRKAERAYAADQALEPKKRKGIQPPDLAMFKDTERDSVWWFRRDRLEFDHRYIQTLAAERAVNWDDLARQVAEGAPRVIPQEIKANLVTQQQIELAHMTAEFQGPFFTIDPNYTWDDFDGSGNKEKHPLAGSLMPAEVEWVQRLDSDLLNDATSFLARVYFVRDQEQERSFRQSANDIRPGSARNRGRTGRA